MRFEPENSYRPTAHEMTAELQQASPAELTRQGKMRNSQRGIGAVMLQAIVFAAMSSCAPGDGDQPFQSPYVEGPSGQVCGCNG